MLVSKIRPTTKDNLNSNIRRTVAFLLLSLLPGEQPCAAANSRSYGHPITRIRSDIEPLITEPRDEDNDLKSIFDVGKLFNTAHSGVSSYAATSFGAENTLESNVVAHSGLSSYAAAGSGALNATENMVVSRSGMTSFAVAKRFSTNAPQDTVTSHASQLPPFTPSSIFNVGDSLM
ncbi:hypothetical protein T459_22698 [Capsicum annuum]|uniref:Uncharacterized protein n=1 Tax=Capsicum annuum TaxID=4072 RepID=A0A2G2YQ88_CAPAN|nr:hypothetical protein T459_22698 [Capsicum annuum]